MPAVALSTKTRSSRRAPTKAASSPAAARMAEGSSSAYYRTREALLGALGDLVADRLAADVAALGESLASCPGDVGRAVAEVSALESTRTARAQYESAKRAQRPLL